ncbi:MAG: hypothetical protein H6573_32430 [Lewinellaceae bacterium]|nr:hypothetical protein [Lewinellaceae bacterium]
METKSIELRIEGLREGKKLSPDLLDIDELVNLLSYARDFLYPEKNHARSRVSIKLEDGSAVIKFSVMGAVAIQSQALLGELNANHDLGLLKSKQTEAIQNIQQFASRENFTLQFGLSEKLNEGLTITRQTEWIHPEEIWVDEELYMVGEIVDVGGKTNPNIHLDTKEFGTITISSDRETLKEDDKNRLYKKQQVCIRIKKNLYTGEIDKKSAKLLAFLDFDENESADEYLDRLIAESKPYMDKIEDPEEWLKNIRGYDGSY